MLQEPQDQEDCLDYRVLEVLQGSKDHQVIEGYQVIQDPKVIDLTYHDSSILPLFLILYVWSTSAHVNAVSIQTQNFFCFNNIPFSVLCVLLCNSRTMYNS